MSHGAVSHRAVSHGAASHRAASRRAVSRTAVNFNGTLVGCGCFLGGLFGNKAQFTLPHFRGVGSPTASPSQERPRGLRTAAVDDSSDRHAATQVSLLPWTASHRHRLVSRTDDSSDRTKECQTRAPTQCRTEQGNATRSQHTQPHAHAHARTRTHTHLDDR